MAVWGNATFEIKDVVDKNPNLYLKRAEIALKDGRYKDALEEIICAETFANGNIDIVSQCIEVKKALRRMGFSSEKDTFKIIQMYANAGDAEALHLMGCIYLRGYYGVEPSYTTALKYFLSANQIDSSKANFEIGYFFCYGLGIKPDYRKAKKYLLEVIKKNDSETSSALCLIGEMYEQGRGVEKDIESAKKFYLKALEYDEHKGLAYLGLS